MIFYLVVFVAQIAHRQIVRPAPDRGSVKHKRHMHRFAREKGARLLTCELKAVRRRFSSHHHDESSPAVGADISSATEKKIAYTSCSGSVQDLKTERITGAKATI